jgi:tRNA (cmo5U34)-methyltransferase
MNFTLQFVKPEARAALMRRIADALRPGGVLILSEKVCFDDPVVNEMHIDLYHAFKSRNGYSDLEISQKRTALENVLVPDTLPEHQSRLLASGFAHCSVWFQCFNFASLIAIKSA